MKFFTWLGNLFRRSKLDIMVQIANSIPESKEEPQSTKKSIKFPLTNSTAGPSPFFDYQHLQSDEVVLVIDPSSRLARKRVSGIGRVGRAITRNQDGSCRIALYPIDNTKAVQHYIWKTTLACRDANHGDS